MDTLDFTYNHLLRDMLLGRRLRADAMPQCHRSGPMLSLWGEDAGIPSGDVHHSRAYRIYLDFDEDAVITDVQVVVEGELLSPCSGYSMETLDAFDYGPVRDWCLRHTECFAPTANTHIPSDG